MEIKIVENIKSQMEQDIKEMKKGKAKSKIIMTPEIFAKVFSPKRIRLLIAIRKNHIKSISDLARQLKRKFEAVHRDISFLKGIGLIKVIKEKKRVIPIIEQPINIPAII